MTRTRPFGVFHFPYGALNLMLNMKDYDRTPKRISLARGSTQEGQRESPTGENSFVTLTLTCRWHYASLRL